MSHNTYMQLTIHIGKICSDSNSYLLKLGRICKAIVFLTLNQNQNQKKVMILILVYLSTYENKEEGFGG